MFFNCRWKIHEFCSCCYRCRVHQQKHQKLPRWYQLITSHSCSCLSTVGLHMVRLKKIFFALFRSTLRCFLFRTVNIILTENTHKNELRLQMMRFTSIFHVNALGLWYLILRRRGIIFGCSIQLFCDFQRMFCNEIRLMNLIDDKDLIKESNFQEMNMTEA